MKSWYDLNGLRLAIEAEPAEFTAIEQYVAPFGRPPCDAHDYSISIVRGPADEIPDGAEIISEGDMLPDVPARMALKEGATWLVVPDRLSIVFETARRATQIRIADRRDRQLLSAACIRALDAALAASGQYLVHGAALALPGARAGALLLCGPSGAGKTTTALALALGGFGLITDDAIVLQPRGYAGRKLAHAWGLPRALKVHRRTAELLPAVQPLLGTDWDSEDEQPLQTAAIGKVAATMPPVPVPIVAVAVLRRRSDAEHRLAPFAKVEALRLLFVDNVRCSKRGVLPQDEGSFAALAAIIAATPTFELSVGATLTVLADFVAGELYAPAG